MVPPPAADPPGEGDEHSDADTAEGRADAADGEPQPPAVLLDAIEEPVAAATQLPRVVGYLEADEQSVRLLAAAACCRIAVATDDERVVEYLIRRLSDRLTDGEVSLELTTTLDYLSSAFPGQVEPVLAELADTGDDQDDAAAADGDADGAAGSDEGAGGFTASAEATVRRTGDVSDIAVRSRFDDLHIRGERHRGRYATTYETLVGDGSDQRAVALRLLNQPEEVYPEFDRRLAEQLGRWADASDHDNVVTVFDWGVDAQPWVATALIEGVLAERDRPSPAVAFRNALALADAVSHLHGRGVVHGGLDARTVGYPGERFDDDVERGPLVNNVGLITVFRHYFDPSDCLDPRFAAPEYYDDRFGRIDHATDIYQLGTVYYRLFTGRPPFTGEFEAVRQAVLSGTPPAPSAVVEGLPPELDEVLAKTMAKQKLRRYETVEQLRGELASVAEEYV
jgi:hypothetical protein